MSEPLTPKDYEPLTVDELAALGDADLAVEDGADPVVATIHTALTRLHASGLVYGGNPNVIDPSGWTKGTLPAVAVYIARTLDATRSEPAGLQEAAQAIARAPGGRQYREGRVTLDADAFDDLYEAALATPPPSGLDAAWQAAEAALPEGWVLELASPNPHELRPTFRAETWNGDGGVTRGFVKVDELTPEAALQALAVALGSPKVSEP